MSGYFSRIAKQSGLRYAAPGPAAAAPCGGHWSEDPIAPEVEQTRMVAPVFPEAEVLAAPYLTDAYRVRPALEPEPAAITAKDHGGRAREEATWSAARQTQDPSTSPTLARAASANSGGAAYSLPQGAARVASDSGAPRVVARTTFRNHDAPDAAREQTGHVEVAERSAPEKAASGKTAGLAAESRQYFTRTADILNNEVAVTPDLHSVVLREVQEWVAAAPLDPPPGRSDSRERVENMAKATPPRVPATRPGVVTIREGERRVQPGRAQPIEQSFELSIGTINVTIEEPEKPRLPEPQSRPPETAARDDDSRFSRLSRSYL